MTPRSVRARLATCLLAVLGVLAVATACDVKPGTAAFVGSSRITEDSVTSYLVKGAQVQAQTGQQNPRQFAVSFLVIQELARDYADSKGIAYGDAQIQAVRTDVLGADADSTLAQARTEAQQAGLTNSFVDLRVFVVSLVTLIEKSGVQDSELGAALGSGPKVKLSPRYGTWNEQTLSIDASTPSYLTLTTSNAAA